jgi:4-hydroxybutyrate CoA-transferase
MGRLELYYQKLMSAVRAVETIRSGERVYVHPGCATPAMLTDALLKRAPFLHDVELVHMLTFGKADYTLPEYDGHFRHNGLFLGENVREAVAAGRADYTPIFLGEIEELFSSGAMPLDTVLLQLSPPDE